ncbi:MAG: helix-turn-helix transcriptional regulator [Oscillospiraceae bacterium]|nr:helix-turn-helix transcriptional regulator [Oscillospiraceae bacterium]
MKSVSERLTAARISKGSSIVDTAEACGISVKALQDYEAGTRVPRDDIKIALANYYGERVQDLFF